MGRAHSSVIGLAADWPHAVGRITLLCGSTGTGKTLLGVDFLINGANRYNEPGVFKSFEETEDELCKVGARFARSD